MKSIFENVIRDGNYDSTSLHSKIETAYVSGRLTEDDRNDLITQMQVNPPRSFCNHKAEIDRLWLKIQELEMLLHKDTSVVSTAPQLWVQPTGSYNGYPKGTRVIFEGHTYESVYDGINEWSPTVYPAGWSKII